MVDRRFVITLCLGQLISLSSLVGDLATAFLQQYYGQSLPDLQNLLAYLLILLSYLPLLLASQGPSRIPDAIWLYFASSLVDYCANYLALFSLVHIHLMRFLIIQCLSTPVVVALSILLFKTQYQAVHYAGILMVLLGILMLGIDEMGGETGTMRENLVCCLSALLFGLSNVSQEYLVRKNGSVHYLAVLGLFGTLFAVTKNLAVPSARDNLYSAARLEFPGGVLLLVGCYGLCMLVFYSLTPVLLQLAGATFFNISLLSTNAYSLVFSYLYRSVSKECILSLLTVVSGLVIFNLCPTVSKVY